MVTVTKESVLKAAENARLHLTDEEVEKYTNQLSEIFSYVEKIQEINTDDVRPTTHGSKLVDVMREDNPVRWERREEALNNAPDSEDGQFKVPTIIE